MTSTTRKITSVVSLLAGLLTILMTVFTLLTHFTGEAGIGNLFFMVWATIFICVSIAAGLLNFFLSRSAGISFGNAGKIGLLLGISSAVVLVAAIALDL